jgi:L-lactate dehydrogenase complex protein LldG
MDNSGQDAFINRIKKALNYSHDKRNNLDDLCISKFTDETSNILDRIRHRTHTERQQLLDRLMEMAAPINLHVIALKDQAAVTAAIVDLVENKSPEWNDLKRIVTWKHPLIDGLNLSEALRAQKVPVHVTEIKDIEKEKQSEEAQRASLIQQVIDSYIGVTSADFCMADTATLVMRARPGQARSISLVPSIHIAVIELDQIIADLKELHALLIKEIEEKKEGLTNCMTYISGPSKTADVEATMVHGAHGPREVYVFVIANL